MNKLWKYVFLVILEIAQVKACIFANSYIEKAFSMETSYTAVEQLKEGTAYIDLNFSLFVMHTVETIVTIISVILTLVIIASIIYFIRKDFFKGRKNEES